MVRDLDGGGPRNGRTMNFYWETLGVRQKDCERQNKRKGKRE